MKRFLLCFACLSLFLPLQAQGDTIQWVDFGVPYASLKYAMEQDIATF